MWLPERTAFGQLRARLLGNLHGDIVEAGAGTGLNFRYYAGDARVLALEPDPAMYARAIQRLRPNVSLRPASDEAMDDLPAASFDAAVFSLVLCSVPDVRRTLERAKRILRPGGVVVLLEHVRSGGVLGTLQDRLTPFWLRVADGCHLNRRTRQEVERAGFVAIDARTVRVPGLVVRDLETGIYRTPSSGQNP